MAGLLGKVARFASSPQGRRALDRVRAEASKPANREKVTGLLSKVQGRGKGGAPRPPAQP